MSTRMDGQDCGTNTHCRHTVWDGNESRRGHELPRFAVVLLCKSINPPCLALELDWSSRPPCKQARPPFVSSVISSIEGILCAALGSIVGRSSSSRPDSSAGG